MSTFRKVAIGISALTAVLVAVLVGVNVYNGGKTVSADVSHQSGPYTYSYSSASGAYNFIVADNTNKQSMVKLWIKNRLNINANITTREYNKSANSVHFVARGTNGFSRIIADVWLTTGADKAGYLSYKIYTDTKPTDATGLRGALVKNGSLVNWRMFYTDLRFK